jgi:hypothetical protein
LGDGEHVGVPNRGAGGDVVKSVQKAVDFGIGLFFGGVEGSGGCAQKSKLESSGLSAT